MMFIWGGGAQKNCLVDMKTFCLIFGADVLNSNAVGYLRVVNFKRASMPLLKQNHVTFETD